MQKGKGRSVNRAYSKIARIFKLSLGYCLFSVLISIFYYHIGLLHYKIIPPFATFLVGILSCLELIDLFPAIILILIFTLVVGVRFLRAYYDLQIQDIFTARISDLFSMSFNIVIANIICLIITLLIINLGDLIFSRLKFRF